MAVLGVIHRSVLGQGPKEFAKFFRCDRSVCTPRTPRRHARHLVDPCGLRWPDYALHSALGAVRLYNILPDYIVTANCVKEFQRGMQRLLCLRASSCEDW
eukprot:837420-Alexandrium_andersonii.AAC.1